MNKCLICAKEIKADHAYCTTCYNKLEKSDAIKKVLQKYKKDEIKVFDNYNHSLKYFDNLYGFLDYTNIEYYKDYKVKKKNINDRIEDDVKEVLNCLRLDVEFSSLIYLDTLYFLRQAFLLIDNPEILSQTKVFMEYSIGNLEQERIDYIIAFKNKLIILEMGQSDSLTLKELSKKKKQQLDNYITNLKKEIPSLKLKQITSEAFVYSSEAYSYNNQIEHLVKLINNHFTTVFNYEMLIKRN